MWRAVPRLIEVLSRRKLRRIPAQVLYFGTIAGNFCAKQNVILETQVQLSTGSEPQRTEVGPRRTLMWNAKAMLRRIVVLVLGVLPLLLLVRVASGMIP
jgi:hypothetical protein